MTAHDAFDPVVDAAGHLTRDTVAALDAGLYAPAAAARLHAHIERCMTCQRSMSAYTDLRARLRALPPPILLETVARRLDDALRRESAHRAAGLPVPGRRADRDAPTPRAPTPTPVTDLATARRSRRRRRYQFLSAAAVVLVGGGIAAAATMTSGRGNGGSTYTAQGTSAPTTAGSTRPAPVPSAPATSPSQSGLPGGRTVGPQFTGPLAGAFADAKALSGALPAIVNNKFSQAGTMALPSTRHACAGSLTADGRDPLAVQSISFKQQPAFVFVFPTAGGKFDVFVVGKQCARSAARPLAHFTTGP
ncbi:MAG: hypothetical protein ACR2JQ_02100 [Mycobacteriales bacterium]